MVYFSKWKVLFVLGIVAFGLIFAAPNLFSKNIADAVPGFLPHKQVNLGLDLQGGSHLLLEVDVKSVLRERLTSAVEGARSVLRRARIRYSGLGIRGQTVSVSIQLVQSPVWGKLRLSRATSPLSTNRPGRSPRSPPPLP